MADRFEQWSRARLGEYVQRDGETFATVIVPVDGEQHDPRADVLGFMGRTTWGPEGYFPIADGADLEETKRFHAYLGEWIATHPESHAEAEAEKPPTTRHRKTRGK